MGLESINASKDDHLPEEERTQAFLKGTKLIERAFNSNQKSASAANALCELFLRKGNLKRVSNFDHSPFSRSFCSMNCSGTKVGRANYPICRHTACRRRRLSTCWPCLPCGGITGEGDKILLFSLGGRAQPCHRRDWACSVADAKRFAFFYACLNFSANAATADEMAAAIHTLDTLLQPPRPQKSLEATVMLASLRAFPRPGVSSSDVAQERSKARELFDRFIKGLEIEDVKAANGHGPGHNSGRASRTIGEDRDMHIEIARLWQNDNLDRMGKALREALRISESGDGSVDPRLLNDLGVLLHLEGNLHDARAYYERALIGASGGQDANEGMATSILYNLARAYEDDGEESLAKDAYEKLIERHPEYVDGESDFLCFTRFSTHSPQS